MTRPHEDLERHTPADHRAGGAPVEFSAGAWCAIDSVSVKASRVDAGISTCETLIEKARKSTAAVRQAAILRSVNKRRVIAFLEINGHEGFGHLRSAWDHHHLAAQRHDVAESSALELYRLAAMSGTATIDPSTHDVYAYEHAIFASDRAPALIGVLKVAQGFRGALIFGSEAGTTSAIVYRFEHMSMLDAFRQGAPARQVLGPVGGAGDSIVAVHAVRTFG
jgi:hypothetical protein